MKKIIVLLIFSTVFSCETRTFTEYAVRNESDYNIKISAYYGGQKYDEVSILSKGEHVKNAIYAGPRADLYLFDGNLMDNDNGIRDSVVITFNDERYIVQWCKRLVDLSVCGGTLGGNVQISKNLGFIHADPNNVRLGESYRKGFKRKQGPFVITFDNSDYQRAVEL